jgi:hypothetical protein
MRLRGAIRLALAFAVGLSSPALAATIRTVPGKSGRVIIELTGMISNGDADVFTRAVNQANQAGKSIDLVQLNSAGGNLGEGAKVAATIKFARLSTAVASGAVCASACFLVFAAGERKFAETGALIGVHKASERGGVESKKSALATVLMAKFARELGVSSSIVSRMVATPPTQIEWLDARDLHSMGVKTVNDLAQVRPIGPPPEQAEAPQHRATGDTAPVPASAPTKQASNRPSWNEFIDKVIALSAEQNQGSPVLKRSCKSESKECMMAVGYRLADGRQGLATAVQDDKGNVTRREVCESNASNDARDCLDWDTGAQYRDFRNPNGEWVQSIAQ